MGDALEDSGFALPALSSGGSVRRRLCGRCFELFYRCRALLCLCRRCLLRLFVFCLMSAWCWLMSDWPVGLVALSLVW